MENTNRIIRSLSQYVSSRDDLRPAMQGVVSAGTTHIATDGHKMIVVEGNDDMRFFEDHALYRIDEKQALNAKFCGPVHEFIDEKYPNAVGVIPRGDEYVHHSVLLGIDVLYSLVRFLNRTGMKNVMLHFPKDPHGKILFEAQDLDDTPYNVERIVGLLMPCMIGMDGTERAWKPEQNPFTDATLKRMSDAINNANARIGADPYENG